MLAAQIPIPPKINITKPPALFAIKSKPHTVFKIFYFIIKNNCKPIQACIKYISGKTVPTSGDDPVNWSMFIVKVA